MAKSNPDKFRKINLHKFNPNEKFVSFRGYLILDTSGNYFHVVYSHENFMLIESGTKIRENEIEFIAALT